MAPEALAQVLQPLNKMFEAKNFPQLLSGLAEPDDATVWKIDEERAIVQSADFFPPVVDDPYEFGAIAAANALSDLYAMGAEPLFALNLVGFPDDLDQSILTEILRGGGEKVKEAGAVVAGGHTTTDKEPKFGLSVTGLLKPSEMLTKGGIKEGDSLILTKALGTGVITTAHKKECVEDRFLKAAVQSMARLNKAAGAVVRRFRPHVHALTDITGFSLMGHAHEMAAASELSLHLQFDRLPLLDGVLELAAKGLFPGGAKRNESHYGAFTQFKAELKPWQKLLMFDPQTSGGLLIAVDPDQVDAFTEALKAEGQVAAVVGQARSQGDSVLVVE